ncbi:chaplin family protein [Streptomyces sp. NPDC088116]|uniref:chaplin family protein n=1 Tax=Streptomyces sp. NPDC088116 TaxID=3365825 RepID=UPI00380A0EF6
MSVNMDERNPAAEGARNVGKRAAAVGAVLGAALVPAGAAHANVVGIGNAVFGNTCVNQGGAQAAAGTVAGSGAASGNIASLPLSLPRNDCGNSGIVCHVLIRASV